MGPRGGAGKKRNEGMTRQTVLGVTRRGACPGFSVVPIARIEPSASTVSELISSLSGPPR